MAVNELRTHAFLQVRKFTELLTETCKSEWFGREDICKNIFFLGLYLQNDASDICENIQFLLGAFETATGEQVYHISLSIHRLSV